MRAAIPVGGRSLRLYEETHPQSKLGNRTVQQHFLKRLAGMIPNHCQPSQLIIVADSGLKTSFFRYIERQLKEDYQWALQADNILLISPSGVGKSNLAAALDHHLIERGIRVKWLAATDLMQQLQQVKKELALMTCMTLLDKYLVMVIDDIGYVKKPMAKSRCYLNLSPIVMKAAA